MSTETIVPKTKFFDTVKKVFPENQNDFYTDRFGCVYERRIDSEFDEIENNANIIAVPFTGQYDINKNPIYDRDVLKCEKTIRDDLGVGEITWEAARSRYRFSNGRLLDDSDWSDCEIIGSSLTNPELLEIK